ncbi:MAG: KH domain-containing protein [Ignavibacteria bacterium]|nr:KH domain-containing protein [Ignavibacteria bacterium]
MKEFLEFIAKSIVDKTDAVHVEELEEEGRIKYKLYVDENEIGKIVGKSGRTAKSIRTLLKAVGAKNGKRASLEIPDKLVRDGKGRKINKVQKEKK